ncbi:MAG TPA: hypothetical protein VNO52_08075 [Methylomirabilota bacterium]|nr:hypothetical protein [Methylomirabilota bacterium]
MKKIESKDIAGSLKTTSGRPEEQCPDCGGPAWCYEDGTVFCIDHGGFQPEPGDVRLYAMREAFLKKQAAKPQDAGKPGGGGTGVGLAVGGDVSDCVQSAYAAGGRSIA